MSVATITAQRAALAAGLRELADFIEEHPDLPIPDRHSTCQIGPHLKGTDAEDRADVDRIAAILGVTPTTSFGGHYGAAREFSGGLVYRAVAIPGREMARWHALTSYRGAVEPAEGA